MKHNHELPNAHFRKHWTRRVKTWFNQPARKSARRDARAQKAVAIAPRPVDGPLRPAVNCPTLKYCAKVRLGRGFSLEELKRAGIAKTYAKRIGISVDHRRRTCTEANLARLALYKSKLVIVKKGDAASEAVAQLGKNQLLPLTKAAHVQEFGVITKEMTEVNAYATRRTERDVKRWGSLRAKKAAEKAAKEDMGKK